MTIHDAIDDGTEGPYRFAEALRWRLQNDPNTQLLRSAMRDHPEWFEHDPLTLECKAHADRRAIREYFRRDAAAATDEPTPANTDLQAGHYMILRVLHDDAGRLQLGDIVSALAAKVQRDPKGTRFKNLKRGTVGPMLTRLRKLDYVEKPDSTRKGDRITETGTAALMRCARFAPED